MDAAFVFARNGDTYFFKGKHYWRFNEVEKRIYTGYPKLITTYWRGVPENIDSALQTLEGETIFFKGGQYYKIQHNSMSVLPSYPKPLGPDWLGCNDDQSEPNILARGDSSSLSLTPSIVVMFIALLSMVLVRD